MATAAPRQLSVSCHLCRCEVTDSKYLRKLGTRTSECATAALDGLCQELDCRRMQLVQGPVCRSCFQDLEKLRKAQTTVALLKARFLGCLRSRVTSTLSPKDSTSRKRSASDSPLISSTPRSRPPAQKRPVVVRTDSLVPGARRSLAFNTEPEADTNSGNGEQLQPSVNGQAGQATPLSTSQSPSVHVSLSSCVSSIYCKASHHL